MSNSFMQIALDEGAFMPERAHPSDAGLDIRSPVDVIVWGAEEDFDNEGEIRLGSAVIKTGVHVAIPVGYVGLLKSKSGLNVKHGITSEGVIDAGYTGEIVVKLYNFTSEPYRVRRGDKISQLVIAPIITPELMTCDKLPGSARGDNGFGSSGR